MRDKGHLILPLIAIIYLMLSGFTITRAALLGCAICIIAVSYTHLKEVQSDMQLSYPAAKKKLDELLAALHLSGTTDEAIPKEVDEIGRAHV